MAENTGVSINISNKGDNTSNTLSVTNEASVEAKKETENENENEKERPKKNDRKFTENENVYDKENENSNEKAKTKDKKQRRKTAKQLKSEAFKENISQFDDIKEEIASRIEKRKKAAGPGQWEPDLSMYIQIIYRLIALLPTKEDKDYVYNILETELKLYDFENNKTSGLFGDGSNDPKAHKRTSEILNEFWDKYDDYGAYESYLLLADFFQLIFCSSNYRLLRQAKKEGAFETLYFEILQKDKFFFQNLLVSNDGRELPKNEWILAPLGMECDPDGNPYAAKVHKWIYIVPRVDLKIITDWKPPADKNANKKKHFDDQYLVLPDIKAWIASRFGDDDDEKDEDFTLTGTEKAKTKSKETREERAARRSKMKEQTMDSVTTSSDLKNKSNDTMDDEMFSDTSNSGKPKAKPKTKTKPRTKTKNKGKSKKRSVTGSRRSVSGSKRKFSNFSNSGSDMDEPPHKKQEIAKGRSKAKGKGRDKQVDLQSEASVATRIGEIAAELGRLAKDKSEIEESMDTLTKEKQDLYTALLAINAGVKDKEKEKGNGSNDKPE